MSEFNIIDYVLQMDDGDYLVFMFIQLTAFIVFGGCLQNICDWSVKKTLGNLLCKIMIFPIGLAALPTLVCIVAIAIVLKVFVTVWNYEYKREVQDE